MNISQKNYLKGNKGITLIALVVTIIILIILAGISINLVLGENGILKQAQKAAKENKKEKVEEEIYLILNEWEIQRLKGTQTIVEFLNSKVKSEQLDEIKEEGNYIEIYKDEYMVVIDFEGKIIEKIQIGTERIKVSNIKVMLEDGVTEVNDNSIDFGTKVKIVFDVSFKDGIIDSVTDGVLENGKVEYTTDGYEMQKEFTITGNKNGETRTKIILISIVSKYKIIEPEIKLSTGEWTNDKIIVDVDWKNAGESDKKEISVDGGESYTEYSGGIDVFKNTTIKARVTTKEGIIIESELAVDKIDKLVPNSFNPTVSDLVSSTELTINANATDQDATEEYGKSEVKGYIYYVYKEEELVNKSEFMTNTSWNAAGLTVGQSYNIYVEAYDNAGNCTKSETISYTKLNVYTWDKYSAKSSTVYTTVPNSSTITLEKYSTWDVYQCVAVTSMGKFDETTGYWLYDTSTQEISSGQYINPDYQGSNRNIEDAKKKYNYTYYVVNSTKVSTRCYTIELRKYTSKKTTEYSQGTTLYETVKSNSSSSYPENGYQSGYWYVKK